jgi:endonuclease/exonuclease/phosphatase family metal-dependent hydrolase
MEVSYRLHIVGQSPSRELVLPELPGATPYEPGGLDRIGEQVQRSWPILGATGVAGAVAGSKLLRLGGGGLLRGALGAVAGAVGGALLGGATLAAVRGTAHHSEPAAAGPVADPRIVATEQLRVMTWNVHGGMGGPGEFGASTSDLDELADVIRRERPDIVLLQEVDRFAARSSHTDTLRELADRLGADSAVSGTAMTALTGRDQDVAVLTFNGATITDARNIIHPDSRGGGLRMRASSFLRDAKAAAGSVLGTDWGREGSRNHVRNTVEALVRTPAGNSVRVLTGHYEGPDRANDHQARQVAPLAGALDGWDGPTIWGADFNVRTNSDFYRSEQRILGQAGMRDAFEALAHVDPVPIAERSTSPQRPLDKRGGIDRIYVSEGVDVDAARVMREAGDASDHLPVVADVVLQSSG